MSDFSACKNWPSYCEQLYTTNGFPEYSRTEQIGPYEFSQTIRTDYSITVAGVEIPIVNTTRDWSTFDQHKLGVPLSVSGVWRKDNGIFWCLDGSTGEDRTYRATEDCHITRATLHYLDLRYGVCLYRKNIEKVMFNLASGATNLFKDPYGTTQVSSLKIYSGAKKNWDSLCTEEWHLIVDGVDRKIAECPYDPIPEMRGFASDGSGDLFDPNYPATADDDIELILSTSPVTSSDSVPWDDELRYHGYYSYRGAVNSRNWTADGACADYFYPAWCRALQEDPFWKEAAAKRNAAYTNPDDMLGSTGYAPATDVTVDPLPRGTFVRHPVVGDVWQFLIGKRDSTTYLETSPNVNSLILDSLNKNGATPLNGTMLYYPIGV